MAVASLMNLSSCNTFSSGSNTLWMNPPLRIRRCALAPSQARIRHPGVRQVEPAQLDEILEVRHPCIRHRRVAKVQEGQLVQALKEGQFGITHPGLAEVRPHEPHSWVFFHFPEAGAPRLEGSPRLGFPAGANALHQHTSAPLPRGRRFLQRKCARNGAEDVHDSFRPDPRTMPWTSSAHPGRSGHLWSRRRRPSRGNVGMHSSFRTGVKWECCVRARRRAASLHSVELGKQSLCRRHPPARSFAASIAMVKV
jgi:hypothetical protein